MTDSIRDRIAELLTRMAPNQQWLRPPVQLPSFNEQTLARRGIYLDDYRAPGQVFREDQYGPMQELDRRLQQPHTGTDVDPRMAPQLNNMLGVSPPNDRAVVDPEELPLEQQYASYRYRA